MPPGEGGGETLESFDPSKGSGRVVMTDVVTSAPLQWPKTYKAPDGVNTITEHADGTGSMTLAWVPRSISDSQGFSGHVITQAEAEEVMVIIRDSLNAHYFALEFYETALKAMKEPAEQAAVLENSSRVMVNSLRLIEFEAKWRKRVEEGKP